MRYAFVITVGDRAGVLILSATQPLRIAAVDDGKTLALGKGQSVVLSLSANPSTASTGW